MLALLAAGHSRRFGDSDKLSAWLGDKPLGLHAAETGAKIPFAQKLVISSPNHGCGEKWSALGYQLVTNENAALGQATSVRLAASRARDAGASALCIMLADMPFVTRDHIDRVIVAFKSSGSINTIASGCCGQAMPPAIFSCGMFDSLIDLQGDCGARALLAEAQLIRGDEHLLMDIDTEEDLAQANIICSGTG